MAALWKLDESLRVPLAFFYITEFSCEKIAGILGIQVEVVISQISQAKEQLRDILDNAPTGVVHVRQNQPFKGRAHG